MINMSLKAQSLWYRMSLANKTNVLQQLGGPVFCTDSEQLCRNANF